MNKIYTYLANYHNLASKFLAILKFVKKKIKEKSILISILIVIFILLYLSFFFIINLLEFKELVFRIVFVSLSLISLMLAVLFYGIYIQVKKPELKPIFKNIDYYFELLNKSTNKFRENAEPQNINLIENITLNKNTIFKKAEKEVEILKILHDNNILNKNSKNWKGIGGTYGSIRTQIFIFIIILKRNNLLLNGVNDDNIITFFQNRIINIELPKKQNFSQISSKLFTDDNIQEDSKYYDAYIKFSEYIGIEISS